MNTKRGMKVITNNVPRPLVWWAELPAEVQADFAHYLDEYEKMSGRFVQYKGVWYDTYDCEAAALYQNPLIKQWHGVQSDSYFSGVLFKFVDDNNVVCGRYFA